MAGTDAGNPERRGKRTCIRAMGRTCTYQHKGHAHRLFLVRVAFRSLPEAVVGLLVKINVSFVSKVA